jgi:hypothetical protein
MAVLNRLMKLAIKFYVKMAQLVPLVDAYRDSKATDYPKGFAEKIYSDQAAYNALHEDRK